MNEYLRQLKEKFGKVGSWALWDQDGRIENIIKDDNFISLLKPNIIFMGLNASRDLRDNFDWANFHYHKTINNISWRREHCSKLANVLLEKEFVCFRGAYMTDVIKTEYYSSSGELIKAIKKGYSIIDKNYKSLKQEMDLLSKISGSDKFIFICIGNASFDILSQLYKGTIHKIWHYSNYGLEDVKKRIREDLREIMPRLQNA
jgi:hypothetical protein